jgi:hypothetical protein
MSSLFAFIVFLNFIILQHILADLVDHSKVNYSKISIRSDYNACKNQSRSTSGTEKTEHCWSYMKSNLQEWRVKRQFSAKMKLKRNKLKLMKIPGCGVKDGPLLYAVQSRW